MPEILAIGVMFASAVALTWLIRAYAHAAGLIDRPNARSSHSLPTPRGGGLAIVAVFLVLLLVLYLGDEIPPKLALGLAFGGGLVASIGLIDDHRDVPAGLRFAVQSIAAIVLVAAIEGLAPVAIGSAVVDLGWFGHLLAVVLLVWLINLFNFMDGIDGLAASEAIFVAGACWLLSSPAAASPVTLLAAGLAAGSAGFLLWNWPPAKIFLGDVGSGFLGLALGAIGLIAARADVLPIWTPLILVGVFVMDATVTLVRRFREGQRWYEAHRSHAYQRMARRYASHAKVTIAVAVVNVVWLLPLAWLSVLRPEAGWWLLLVAWAPLGLMASLLGAGRAQ